MIVDVHAHIFPYLGGVSGLDSVSTHMMYFQKAIAGTPATAVRRIEDSDIVKDWALWDDDDLGPGGRLNVNLRVSRFGRIEWTGDRGDYYVNLYAPTLQEMIASPEFMVAQMDYAGVDVAVLQNAWLYGQLNEYFAKAVEKYPERFVGTVQLREVEAFKESQIAILRYSVNELGLTGGLYFATLRFFENAYRDHLDDGKFFPLWEEVRKLGIPIFWDISPISEPSHPSMSGLDCYCAQMKRLGHWLQEFPDIPCILVHGVLLKAFCEGDQFVNIPDEIWDVWKTPTVHLEILFPIQVSYPRPGAGTWDYPYSQVRSMIQQLYEELGAEKLLWGSDMPNVERNCTYKQSLDYLARYCTFIPPDDMDLILGGNATRIFGISS